MSSSKFATSFAPYTPPPDDRLQQASSSKPATRPWFPTHQSSLNVETSYQSGGIPTFGASEAGGVGAVEEAEGLHNQWETRYGMKVPVLAAAAYLLGPLSALVLLVVETVNDYVRFHAYQSALLTTPLVIIRIFASLLQFPFWLRTFFTLLLVCPVWYMSFRAHLDASKHGLARFRLPVIGPIAEQWLAEE